MMLIINLGRKMAEIEMIGGQMCIAFNASIPARGAPDYQQSSEYSGDNAKRSLVRFPQALGNTHNKEGRDKNAGRYIPKSHHDNVRRELVNFNCDGQSGARGPQ